MSGNKCNSEASLTNKVKASNFVRFLFLFSLFLLTKVNAQTFVGNLELTSQAEVDTFDFTEVTGFLVIDDGVGDISNLNGLSELTSVGSYLILRSNPALINIDGLSNLTSVGSLYIEHNWSLSNLNGLSNLTSVEYFRITANALINLDGLSNLTSVGGMYIRENINLANINGLSNLISVGVLDIQYNIALNNIDGLSNLTSVSNTLNIQWNDALTNIDGLSNLTSINYVDIWYNNALINLDGLSNLTTVGAVLSISQNYALINLDGLSNLTTVGDNLIIQGNTELTNINGLSSLSTVQGNLDIQSNSSLTAFCGLYPLLSGGGLAGNYFVLSNGANPTLQEIIDGGPCITNVSENEILPNKYELQQNYPNPFNPSTMISFQLPISGNVTLKVYDILGNEVATLVNEEKTAGYYEVEFNGEKYSSGVYFYRMRAGNFIETKKMVLLK